VTLLRGLRYDSTEGKAADLYRNPEFDLYR